MKLTNKYSLAELFKMMFWLIRTKLICYNARLIRFPFVIRGGQHIDLGTSLTTGVGCRLEAFATDDNSAEKKIRFGHDVQINDYVHISAIEKVEIGDNVLMASHVYISDNSHGIYSGGVNESSPLTPPKDREYITAPVRIGKNVWLGEGVIVMPGVEIGDGCVIGAHSIVNKSIPANCIAVGAPAKVVKVYSFEEKCWKRI